MTTRARCSVGAAALLVLSVFALGACDGGSGARTPPPAAPEPPAPPPPPPPPSGPAWTQGVYEPASRFINRCEVVRTGVDIEGNPFPDRPGSTREENFWLRSWTNETYLWKNEVQDRNPANFSDRLAYYALLRTTATTPSGRDKDEFHFSMPTEDYLEQRNSAPSAGYGAAFIAYSTTPPRDFRVAYVQPGSPAAQIVSGQMNLPRGARIMSVDGVDVVNDNTQSGVDAINNALFPAQAGSQHVFVVEDAGAAGARSVTLVSANLTPKAVNRTKVIDTGSGKVGYLMLTTFSPFAAEKDIADAIAAFRADGVNDLVIDLRYNGGGLLAVASQLAYMVAGAGPTSGKAFERLRFNTGTGGINPVTGQSNQPLPFFSTGVGFSLPGGEPLESLDLPRVFILSTERTCSASESVMNSLRGAGVEVILVGETTCGKPYGFYPQDNCGETYFSIQFQGVNHSGFGDYADGFTPENSGDPFAVNVPGCAVADDLGAALGDETEPMLAAALAWRETGVCPAPAMGIATKSLSARGGETAVDIMPGRSIFETNRDMRMPD